MEEIIQPIISINIHVNGAEVTVFSAVLSRSTFSLNKEEEEELEQDTEANLFELTAYEFLDNLQLSNLDVLINQIGPAKYLFPEDLLEYDPSSNSPYSKSLIKKIKNLFYDKPQEILKEAGRNATQEESDNLELDKLTSIYSILPVKKSFFKKKSDTLSLFSSKFSNFSRFSTKILDDIELHHSGCISCIEALWEYLSLRSLSNNTEDSFSSTPSSSTLLKTSINVKLGSFSQFMRLDSATIDALGVCPTTLSQIQDNSDNNYASLYHLLNHTKTRSGSRTLIRWLRQPLTDINEINKRLNLVESLLNCTHVRLSLREGPLKSCPDLVQLSSKIRKKKGTLSELLRLHLFVQALPTIVSLLEDLINDLKEEEEKETNEEKKNDKIEQQETVKKYFLTPLVLQSNKFKLLSDLAMKVIDLEALPTLRVHPNVDPKLSSLADEQNDLINDAEKIYLKLKASSDFSGRSDCLKLERSSQYGVALRLTNSGKNAEGFTNKNNKNSEKYRTLTINKNGEIFTCKELEKIGERLIEIEDEYQELQESIVKAAMETTISYLPLLESINILISDLDVLQSMAHAISQASSTYSKPKLTAIKEDELPFANVKAARHPLVERFGKSDFLPNDFDLNQKDGIFHIITGPNMGGKSTYIRTLGCLYIMAQIGCFLPCDSASLSIADSVLARVGAGDALTKGMSTFMAEMVESSSILTRATKNSLVLIDELGRGTSTFDGFGLAWAISCYLSNISCITLFATHFHELTALENYTGDENNSARYDLIRNKHVTAMIEEGGEVRMLYRIKNGPSTQSYGVPVAAAADFPKSTIICAKRRARILEKEMNEDDEEGMKRFKALEDRLENFTNTDFNKYTKNDEIIVKEKIDTIFSNDPYAEYLDSLN